MRQANGFTLIELMIAVAVVAILTAFAYPSYQEHIRRTQLQEAFATLSDFRLRLEQYYQDNRTYANAAGDGCGVAAPSPENPRFLYGPGGAVPPGCVLDTTVGAAPGQSYTITAAGNAGSVVGFSFTINERNVRTTTAVHGDWGTVALPVNRWLDRRP